MSDNLKTYEIFLRESTTSLKIVRETCQAASIKEARDHFEQTYGNGRTVAGPSLVKTAD
jgi:hypothetical protein